jgi:uncharacterized protein
VSAGAPLATPVSAPVTDGVRVVQGLRVPMRDGVELALDLLRPDVPEPLPVVLYRTPYDKVKTRTKSPSRLPQLLAERGYVVAFNDCRGRFNSDGVFRPYFHEADDGYDTVEWIAAQDWCDGNVGMLGGSYVGETQWYAASRRPPHLKAIVPSAAGPGTLWDNEPICGGCLRLPMAEFMVVMGQRSPHVLDHDLWTQDQHYFSALPLSAVPERAGTHSAWWDEWMAHPSYDAFWKAGAYDNFADMDVATLNISGWWDSNSPGAPANFAAMRATPNAEKQKLVIGPWPHRGNRTTELNGVDFGPHAIIDLDGYVIRFFDRWLRGMRNGIDDEKPVHVYVVGANEWWAADSWPLPCTEETALYLRSHGRLRAEPPGAEPYDGYRYDPTKPVGALWNINDGPVDDRAPTDRADCLRYTSDVLTEPLDVVGVPHLRLHASSSARDTDWHVRLVDVHPDGAARFLCHGALRARFRESYERPRLLEPGRPTSFDVKLDPCGVRFQPGHRIRVEISSSWFPFYDRNTNSGADNFFTDDTLVVADQRVYHRPRLASRLILPVVRH